MGNSRYAFDVLTSDTDLLGDQPFVDYLISTHQGIWNLRNAPQFAAVLRDALSNEDVAPDIIAQMINANSAQNPATMYATVLDQIEDFLLTADIERLSQIAHVLGAYLREYPVRDASCLDRVQAILVDILDRPLATSEYRSVQDSLAYIVTAGYARSLDYVRYLNECLSVRRVDLMADAAVELSRPYVGRTGGWVHNVVDHVASLHATPEMYDLLLSLEIKPLIDMDTIVGKYPCDADGSYALAYAARFGFSDAFMAAALPAPHRWGGSSGGANAETSYLVRLAVACMDDENAEHSAQRRAFAYLCGNDKPAAIGYAEKVGALLRLDLNSHKGLPYEVQDQRIVMAAARLSDVRVVAAVAASVRDDALYRDTIADLPTVLAKCETAPDAAVMERLWATISDRKANVKTAPAQEALIRSGFLPESLLNDLSKRRGNVGTLAKAALAAAVPTAADAETEQTEPEQWDRTVTANTDFRDFALLAKAAGFTGPAALGMYAVDTRFDLDVRQQARGDFMKLLSAVPSYADAVPDHVWTALNRVKDPMNMSIELAEHLQTLGEAAARFGSRNLVKTTLTNLL